MDLKRKTTIALILVLGFAFCLSLFIGRFVVPSWSGFDSPAHRSSYCIIIVFVISASNGTILLIRRGFIGNVVKRFALFMLLFFVTYFLFFPIYPVGFTYLPYSLYWCIATILYWESSNRLLELRIRRFARFIIYTVILVTPYFLPTLAGYTKLPELWIICQLLPSILGTKFLSTDLGGFPKQDRRKHTIILTTTFVGSALGILIMLAFNNFSWSYDFDEKSRFPKVSSFRDISCRHASFEQYLRRITNEEVFEIAISYIDSAESVIRTEEERMYLDLAKVKLLIKLNDSDEAFGLLDVLLARYPNNARLYLVRSKVYRKAGDLASEISDLKRASDLGSSEADRRLDSLTGS